MSVLQHDDPTKVDALGAAAIEQVIVPRARDLGGGFEVRRALPAAGRQMVGPFIFLDQMGPTAMALGQGLDVRPHPHIGLATVTYLIEGEIMHRDSLGTIQAIRPGAVNLMTAGRGIAHSERSPSEERARGPRLFGLQLWLALPAAQEEMEAAFVHRGTADLPMLSAEGKDLRVVLGQAYGLDARVPTTTDTLLVDAKLDAGASLPVDAAHEERGLYIISGEIEIGGIVHESGRLLVLRPGDAITLRASAPSRVVLLGGATMDGPRHIWWNFVSSRKDRIEAAKADWLAGRFDAVPGETEFIPLPS
jgi:redox-sensitive bicupin YhaK (pirin superfamily)